MGKYSDALDSIDPLGRQNRIKRNLEREIRQQAAAKRARFADIGDDYTMTPEGPLPSAPMPLPDGLTITAGTEVIKVVWSGSASDTIPEDFGRLAIHVSKFTGYTPTQGTEVATVSSPYGGSALYAADGGDTYYVRCAIASLRGDYGPFTDEVTITPGVAADPDTFEGDIVGGSISIATVAAGGDLDETFSGTTFPSGWAYHPEMTGYAAVPDPAVTSTGVPTGSDNGSAVLFDFGPAGSSGALEFRSGWVELPVAEVVDGEMRVRFRHEAAGSLDGNEALWLVLRGDQDASVESDPDNGIGLNVAGSSPYVAEMVAGSSTTLGAPAMPAGGLVAGVWYWARLSAVGGRVEAAIWADGNPEPDPALMMAENAVNPGVPLLYWSFDQFLGGTIGLDTYVDVVQVSRYATGFTVLPDGTARMTRAEIDTMPTKLQAGQEAVTVAAASTRYTQAVVFPEPFLEVPEVMVTPYVVGVETAFVSATNVTATGFTLNYYRTNVANMTVGWVAVAP